VEVTGLIPERIEEEDLRTVRHDLSFAGSCDLPIPDRTRAKARIADATAYPAEIASSGWIGTRNLLQMKKTAVARL
jgi:hypothetical protein